MFELEISLVNDSPNFWKENSGRASEISVLILQEQLTRLVVKLIPV